jgi:hypothetical protein
MNTKQQLVADIAQQLKAHGYIVYLSKNREYGFYTDGKRVVSFGSPWNFCVNFSGNYSSTHGFCGTGWQFEGGKELGSITAEQAEAFIKADAPHWAIGRTAVTYTTPEQYLKTYGESSGFAEV